MCWDNKNRAFGFVEVLSADAAHQKLKHGTSSMRIHNNHNYSEFESILCSLDEPMWLHPSKEVQQSKTKNTIDLNI
jgi:hypothetical protein